jgi:hypothetical protein
VAITRGRYDLWVGLHHTRSVDYPDAPSDNHARVLAPGGSCTSDLRPSVRLHIILVEIVLPVDPVVATENVDIVFEGHTGVEGPRAGDRAMRVQLIPAPAFLELFYIG